MTDAHLVDWRRNHSWQKLWPARFLAIPHGTLDQSLATPLTSASHLTSRGAKFSLYWRRTHCLYRAKTSVSNGCKSHVIFAGIATTQIPPRAAAPNTLRRRRARRTSEIKTGCTHGACVREVFPSVAVCLTKPGSSISVLFRRLI